MPEVQVDPEPIPEELKERDQWLLWDKSAERKQPFTLDSAEQIVPASWTNPDEWLTFDEAVQVAEDRDPVGIGYVFANTNDKYARGLYGALDLDGCVGEIGLKDWVPGLDPFLDAGAYIERSPSGEGLHIPLAGFEPPDWWSDEHRSADEHEGVEAYGSKFFTFTGDQVEGSGDTVADAGEYVDDWLAAVYEELTGEDPRETVPERSATSDLEGETDDDSSTSYGDEYLTREDVEDALSHINPDVEYPTWRNIGFALASFFDSERVAQRVFTDWSRGGSKWDREAEDLAERIIADEDGAGKTAEIGTVIHHARQGGWEMPTPSDSMGGISPRSDIEPEDLDDDKPIDKQAWELWSDERVDGDYGQDSVIPALALKYIARERNLYDFEDLPEDVGELPAKAHNRALYWVENQWPDETGLNLDDDEAVTARSYKSRTDAPVFTWEDVRYIYDESKEDGRYAAVQLLRSKYEFLTPEDTERLHVYDEDLGIFDRTAVHEIGRELDRNLEKHYSQHDKNEIIGRLKERTVERSELEAREFDTNYVCVKNGVLNLDTHDLEEHDPKFNFTTHLPVEYDPDAVPERTLRFLRDITRRREDIMTLLEMVGHTLLPSYDPQKILVLFGEGSNGKSTWLEVVRKFLNGPEGETRNAQSLTMQQITDNRFGASNLIGAWANIGEDLPQKKIQDLGRLKDLTGDNEASVEPKGEDIINFKNRATMMFAANRPPVLPERTTAVKRRLVPVHLPYEYVPEPNPDDGLQKRQSSEDLVGQMTTEEELSGLLNLALDGLERLDDQDDVSLPEEQDARLELYERYSDHIKAFRVDCLANEEDEQVLKDDVYNAYTNFCNENDYTSVQDSVFWKNLRQTTLNVTERRLAEQDDGSRPRVLEGVTFTEHGQQYAPGYETADEDTDDPAEDADSEEPTPIAALELGRHDIEATIATVSQGEYNREAQGDLRGPHGTYVGFVIPGGNENVLGGFEGESVCLENVKMRTDDDGLREVVVNDATTVAKQESTQTGLDPDAGDDDSQAAADGGELAAAEGGPPTDAEGSRATAQRLAEVFRREGIDDPDAAVAAPGAAGLAADEDLTPDQVATALEYGATEMNPALFQRDPEGGGYWLN